ncbi:branched-chain amino acid ABC transporter substrate-binding protein [Intrasporangium chromatireducens Q5-1]|uniref:Branched-chain amino acid ABC transporter substrate-binding protein n=1 Tax=Intrasporangium chromatireducens Q5-1 TaxID=584657 RepID=W9GN09_9MICO|nr:ABC transporter ATP-binding protein [Intrasporangium chromatireducens]EWT05284.1 branched-chain amino acid ABC transporter substrate-binding protein [Intrasporangium chromatireducens Q5-1]
MIEATAVGWRVGGAQILDDVSLSVGAGELLGIIGPNGAGKSSLVNILSGVQRPTTGRISLGDKDVTRTHATKRARMGLARSFQTSALFDGLTAGENVRLAIQASGERPFSPFRRAEGDEGDRVDELLERVRMPGRAATLARDLSHGDRRKLELAMALASEPTVLLLDEPMAGVSAEDVDGLTDIIGEVRDSGVAVAMVEHHMHVVLGLADRVAVLHHGQVLATGSPDDVTSDERVQQAYLGEAL